MSSASVGSWQLDRDAPSQSRDRRKKVADTARKSSETAKEMEVGPSLQVETERASWGVDIFIEERRVRENGACCEQLKNPATPEL